MGHREPMWKPCKTNRPAGRGIIKPSFRVCVLVAAVFYLLLPGIAVANVSVALKLDRTEAAMADSIRMSVTVSGTKDSDAQPVVQGLDDFYVSTGGTSSRVQIINGKVDASADYTYYLQPKRIGTFQIGPATVALQGKTYTSNTIGLKVTQTSQATGVEKGPIFLDARLSAPKVYVEGQVVYTLKLYRRTRVSDLSLELPQAEGLVIKKLGEPTEYQSVYNGSTYQVLEIRYAVIPSREGDFAIQPARMSMNVFQPTDRSKRDPFEDPFFQDPFFSFSRGKPMTLASEPLDLHVLPLPVEGRPAGFSGLVGAFQIESHLEPSEIKAGGSATLTVRLTGRGNVSRIPDLEIPTLPHTKVYADQPVLEITPDEKGIAGSKTMKWAVVPEKEGKYEIPPLAVSFFDTAAEEYTVAQTAAVVLHVVAGERQEPVAATPAVSNHAETESRREKREIEALGHDILPVHASVKDLTAPSDMQPKGLAVWLVLAAPPFVFGAFNSGKRIRRKSGRALAAARARKAAGAFFKVCRERALPAEGLAEAVRDYLNERFALTLGTLTPNEAFEILRSRGVHLETAQYLKNALRQLEDTIYTGKGSDPCPMGEDVNRIVRKIEKELR
jgi:hypothetical protein